MEAQKLKVLKSLKPISLENINKQTVRGQYDKGSIGNDIVQAYKDDLGHDSNTETFVAIKAEISNWRWATVPFYLRTGKRLKERYSEIDIFFKPLKHNIFADKGTKAEPNHLQISLQPDSQIMLRFMNKKPILGNERNINIVSDYNISNVSTKIERIILSHIDFVNRVVWQKE